MGALARTVVEERGARCSWKTAALSHEAFPTRREISDECIQASNRACVSRL
jgi:hypothetical protein